MTEATIRCEHLACLCEVSRSAATCSPYCASPAARDPQNVRCECGHPTCTDQIDAQLHDRGGRKT